jgi:mono/diheme cytochrome c family protein
MPPFPHLSEPEIRAIYAYLKQLAEVPGAEKQQETVEESHLRVGEHIVKSTCHICHNAAGPNPGPEQLLSGAIPPLSSLTTRTSLPEFERKIRSGAPIMMGTPLSPYRGRMPVFYYLREDEVADAYFYLSLNPPYEWAVLDPVMPAPAQNLAASKLAPSVLSTDLTTGSPPIKASDAAMASVPIVVDISVVLLMVGGMWFTVREIGRLTAKSEAGKLQTIGQHRIVLQATHSVSKESQPGREEQRLELASHGDLSVAVASDEANSDDKQGVRHSGSQHSDHSSYESSWLARRLEKEGRVA